MIEPVYYRYFNPSTHAIDITGMLEDISRAEKGSIFMLHACAHNPTGCDPSHEQWKEISQVMKEMDHVVFFDCAYQVW